MISTVVTAVKVFGIFKSVGLFLGALLLIGGMYSGWYVHVFRKGESYAVAKIAANDARMVGRAKKARGVLLQCQNLGKSWNQSTGECQ